MDDAINTSYVAVGAVLNLDPTLIEIYEESEGQWWWNEPAGSWQKIEDGL
jgi:hypothetical protein